jgi:hypothetical protein
MKNNKKIEFHLPDDLTGKQFAKFLKRNNMHFISPKKKIENTSNEELHNSLHESVIQEKLKKGLLTKVNKES